MNDRSNRNAERIMQLSATFDIAELLPTVEKIKLYVDMLSYDCLKTFAEDALDTLKRDLIAMKDRENLELLKNYLYSIGIAFTYHLPEKSVYDNKHNVHVLAQSTLDVARNIIKSYPTTNNKFYIPMELKEYKHFFKSIQDSTLYNNTLDPKQLFMSVWNCICNSSDKIDLLNRLKQELDDAQGHCLTGCIVRLVNALRGFDFIDFETKLDEYEYERSKTFNILTRHMNQNNITEPGDIIHEIERIVNSDVISLSPSYGKRILDAYTGTSSWHVVNGKYINT